MNGSVLHLADDAILDNPIWNSLLTDHAHLAVGEKAGQCLARRDPSEKISFVTKMRSVSRVLWS